MAKVGEIITTTNGNRYKILKLLGRGGQAKVCKVQSLEDNREYAYKVYKENKNNIKANITDLIALGGLRDKDHNCMSTVVLPKELVEGEGASFGYIMELVDLSQYTTLKKAWLKEYPNCKALCNIVANLADFFEALHNSNGMCYKDINEGNIFFHPITGDVKVIDNDNIGRADKFTIKGTMKYMAPEVVLGKKQPDHRTDAFSFAVYIYRLLIGGYPFDGALSKSYCDKHDVTEADAAKIIYGRDALFVWHPTDKRNSLEYLKDPEYKAEIEGQSKYWNRLPNSVKKMFISIFVDNLPMERRGERPTDNRWKEIFKELEKNITKCPKCGELTFSDEGLCFYCGAIIAKPVSAIPTPKTPSTGEPPITHGVHPRKVQSIPNTIRVEIKTKGNNVKTIKSLFVNSQIKGTDIATVLPTGYIAEMKYFKTKNILGLKNISNNTWRVKKVDGSIVECPTQKIVALEKNVIIAFVPGVVQIKVITVE